MSWPVNWLFGSSKPSVNSFAHYQKIKQIESVKNQFPQISEINPSEYNLPIELPNKNIITLNIVLPNDYPNEKPIIKVNPPYKHAWIDESLTLNASPWLKKYMPSIELVDIIKNIIGEFYKNPPIPLLPPRAIDSINVYPDIFSLNDPNHNSLHLISTTSGNVMDQTYANIVSNHNRPKIPSLEHTVAKKYEMPTIPVEYTQLDNLDAKTLKELNEDDGKLIELISQLPQIKILSKDREIFLDNIEEEAKNNLTHKPIIEQKKSQLNQKISQINECKKELTALVEQMKTIADKYDPTILCLNFKIASNHAEERSDKLYHEFLQGKMKIDEFLPTFLKQRKTSHLRRIKEEKLHQLYQLNPHHYNQK